MSVRVYLFTVNATSLHLFMLRNLCQIAPLTLPCQQCHFSSESLLPSQPVCVYHVSTIFTDLRPSPPHQPCLFHHFCPHEYLFPAHNTRLHVSLQCSSRSALLPPLDGTNISLTTFPYLSPSLLHQHCPFAPNSSKTHLRLFLSVRLCPFPSISSLSPLSVCV